MIIKQENLDNVGRFYIEENNDTLAEMDYQLTGTGLLNIVHTEVDGLLAGKGVGKQLVAAAVDYARAKSMHINATCSFAKKVLDRTAEFADVYIAEKDK